MTRLIKSIQYKCLHSPFTTKQNIQVSGIQCWQSGNDTFWALQSIWGFMYPIFESYYFVFRNTVRDTSVKLQEYYPFNQWSGDRYLRNRFREYLQLLSQKVILSVSRSFNMHLARRRICQRSDKIQRKNTDERWVSDESCIAQRWRERLKKKTDYVMMT